MTTGPDRIGSEKSKPARKKRRFLLVPAALLVVGTVLAIPPIAGAQARLEEARKAVEKGREAILEGDPAKARDAFIRAAVAFRAATADLRNPMMAVVGGLPLLGRSADALEAMTEAGALAAKAGRVIAAPAAELAEDRPADEVVPLQLLADIAPHLGRATRILDRARTTLHESPQSLLLAPVASVRTEFVTELDKAIRAVELARTMSRILPAFLGEGGTKTYFLGAQNPAELRGTGGLVGAWSIVKARDGRIEFGEFASIGALDNLPRDVVRVHSTLAARYDRFGGLGFWPNINMSPFFPHVARAIEQTYRKVTGVTLDGVILADPFVLENLLEVTGPVPIPRYGLSVNEKNVVRYVTNRAYSEIKGDAARQEVLGKVAARTFKAALAGSEVDLAARALVEAAAEGHVLLHSTDSDTQSAFEEARVAGALPVGGGDYLAVIGNNASGTKIDFYARRRVSYQVQLEHGGGGRARAEVRLHNDAPRRGQPRYVIGPLYRDFDPGENVTYVSVYCARRCRPEGVRRGGDQIEAPVEEELGHPVLPAFVRIANGKAARLEYFWEVSKVWRDAGGGGVYRLTFQGQPSIRATDVVLDIVTPPGTEVTSASPGVRFDGNRARWEGKPRFLKVFTIRFE